MQQSKVSYKTALQKSDSPTINVRSTIKQDDYIGIIEQITDPECDQVRIYKEFENLIYYDKTFKVYIFENYQDGIKMYCNVQCIRYKFNQQKNKYQYKAHLFGDIPGQEPRDLYFVEGSSVFAALKRLHENNWTHLAIESFENEVKLSS